MLIDGLSPTLKALIDRLLAKGQSKAEILWLCRRAGRGKLTLAAVEAYLERRRAAGLTPPA